MSKTYTIPIFLLFTVLMLDMLSYRGSGSEEQSLSALHMHCDRILEQSRDQLMLLDKEGLFDNDSLTAAQLRSLTKFEESLSEKFIYLRFEKKGKPVFWAGSYPKNGKCISYGTSKSRLRLCISPFDSDGKLRPEFQSLNGIHNQLVLSSEFSDRSSNWNEQAVVSTSKYRSSRLNDVLLLLYLALFSIFIWKSFSSKTPFILPAVVIARVVLLVFESWHQRFANANLFLPLFEWKSYSNIDLYLDLLFLACGLLYLARTISDRQNFVNLKLTNLLGLVLLAVFILAHMRLVQCISLCEQFTVTINDISSISLAELLVFCSLIIYLAGLFIFATSQIQKIKSSTSRTIFYSQLGLFTISLCFLAKILLLHIPLLYLALFLLCFLVLIDLFIDVRQKSVTWLIWWAIFFGAYMASLFFNYDIQKEIRLRKEFLENIAQDADSRVLDSIINTDILNKMKDSLSVLLTLPDEAFYNEDDILKFLKLRFDRDDLLFDISRNPASTTFNKFNSKNINIPYGDGYLFEPVFNRLWKEYPVNDSLTIYCAVLANPPPGQNFPIAIEYMGKIRDYRNSLSNHDINVMKNMHVNSIEKQSRVYLKEKSAFGFTVYTYKEFESLIKPIALFSFLFTNIIVLFILLGLLSKRLDIFPVNWPFSLKQFESLNARIQSALILVILLSFVIIAIITSRFLTNFIEEKNAGFLAEKIESVQRDLAGKTAIANSGEEALAIANNYQKELESVHDLKLHFFKLTDPDTSARYTPYAHFSKLSNPRTISEINSTSEFKAYVPFYHDNSMGAYYEIRESSDAVRSFNVYDFLGSVFNVYVFLFLIASVLSIFIARSITMPLSLLNEKLRELRLGKRNELVQWDRDDEVGSLINNYNNMVKQLENSAEILAKTERDSAWREMAKQVAHEIKNPLTPMRMYIQHLEKAIKQQPDKAPEISKKIAQTLLEQVENLTQIADSFSNFAELPQSANEKLEINKVVELVHNLFRKRSDMDIRLSEPIDPIYVYADKNQLIRVLNNIVKNAIEAIPPDRHGEIMLELYKRDEKAVIKVSDNGSGIAPDMHEKIFQPKFTTKDSGSGLGLAIAMNMIESMNGRMYFKSVPGQGTQFFIELDILRQNFEEKSKRITLD